MPLPPPGPPHDDRRGFLAKAAALGATAALPAGLASPAAAEPTEWLNVPDFGARGDGVTDDGPALIRMRDYMRQDRSKLYIVYFPPGHYVYTNNRWLAHIGAVTIEGEGAKLQCTLADASEPNTRPINTQSIFMNLGDAPWPIGMTYDVGRPLQSAARGAGSIRLVNAADAETFRVGDRVLLHGFDQQFVNSYPPNLRYFEWNVINSISLTSGELMLATPLTHDYDASWPDFTYDAALGLVVGRPRILSLDRPMFVYPRHVELIGAEFLANPLQPDASNGLVIAADTLVLRNCIHHGWTWPSENRRVVYENCLFDGHIEGDKICDEVSFLRCTVRGVLHAFTGVNRLTIDDCDIVGGYLNISPRQALVQNNEIQISAGEPYGAIRGYYGAWPVAVLACYDNVITHDGSLLYAINNAIARALTVSAVGASNEIVLEATPFNRDEVVRQLMPGTVLTNSAGTNSGTVTRVGWDGAQWVLEGTWQAPVQAGESWQFNHIGTILERGTTFVGGDRPLFFRQQT
jgi:hypothetical protein